MTERRTRGGPARALVALLTVLAVLGVGACASIPDQSSPQPIRSFERERTSQVVAPSPNMDPEALIRAFFRATAVPTSRHLAARQFLTQSASDNWNDDGPARIVSSINVLRQSSTNDSIEVEVQANTVGTLSQDGQLRPSNSQLSNVRLTLTKVDGQWRISDGLFSGLVIDETEFLRTYEQHTVYFASLANGRLVPDPRWLYVDPGSLPDQLLGVVFAGPSADLAGAVHDVPEAAAEHGDSTHLANGGLGINLTGVTDLSATDRLSLGTQIVWSLAASRVSGPYQINADNVPLVERFAAGWTVQDVMDANPNTVPANQKYIKPPTKNTLFHS